MSGTILWKYWLWWALFASPAVPIAYAWRRLRMGAHAATAMDAGSLVIASISSLWFDAVVANWRFLGPLYGRVHYAIAGGNLIADLLCLLVCLLSSFAPVVRAQRLSTALACLMLALEWGRIGIANR
ncbi:MAG TPA: hypothetical protein VMD55_11940 [Terracidiphilus sp.]|nr:hypothetical protein [Terracidiphilus sp.]